MTGQERLPPQDLDAELAVLGSMLRDDGQIPVVRAAMSVDDFYTPAHARVFEAICGLADDGRDVDLVTLADALRAAGHLEGIGGVDVLVEAFESVPSAARAEQYADIVRETAARRAAVNASQELAEAGHNQAVELCPSLRDLRARLDAIEVRHDGRPRWDGRAVAERVVRLLEPEERQAVSWSTGLPRLDKLTGGLEEASLVTIGGRSAHNKTGFATGPLTKATLDAGRGVIYATWEENQAAVWRRAVATPSGASPSLARKGELRGTDKQMFIEWSAWLADQPFVILEAPSLAELEAETKDRRPSLVVIDTLQALAHAEPFRKGIESMRLHLGDMIRGLKRLVTGYQVCAVVLSHVASQSGKSKEIPHKHDLAESRQIEWESDTILMVWWPKVDWSDHADEETYMQRYVVQVQKNRIGGPNGALAFGIDPPTQELSPLSGFELRDTLREFGQRPPAMFEDLGER